MIQMIGLSRTRVLYIESVARVKSLSLTGKLLCNLGIADMLLVQWPELAERYNTTSTNKSNGSIRARMMRWFSHSRVKYIDRLV